MKIDSIEMVVLAGNKEINRAMLTVEKYAPEELVSRMEAILKEMSLRFLDHLADTNHVKKHIKKYLDGNPIRDVPITVKRIILDAEEEQNDLIIAAKKSDSRQNRTKQKAAVMKYYRENKIQLVWLLRLYNLFLEAKAIIDK